MELKSNRKLPPWRPGLVFCACREQSNRAQGLARLSCRGQEAGAAPELQGGSVPKLLCPPHAGRWLWGEHLCEVCAQVPQSCQTQERLKVDPSTLVRGNSPGQRGSGSAGRMRGSRGWPGSRALARGNEDKRILEPRIPRLGVLASPSEREFSPLFLHRCP